MGWDSPWNLVVCWHMSQIRIVPCHKKSSGGRPMGMILRYFETFFSSSKKLFRSCCFFSRGVGASCRGGLARRMSMRKTSVSHRVRREVKIGTQSSQSYIMAELKKVNLMVAPWFEDLTVWVRFGLMLRERFFGGELLCGRQYLVSWTNLELL